VPTVRVERKHGVGVAEARRRVEGLVRELGEKYGLAATWTSGTHADIAGRGAKGHVDVGADRVDVTADLPFLLSPMKGTIEQGITTELARLFPAGGT
jgi:putative polyhydroxyalkanoate system protein